MKKTFLPVLFISITCTAYAHAEPIRRLLIPCASEQKIAVLATTETLARPDRNIFKTKVYAELMTDMDKDATRKVYHKFFAVAQGVIDLHGTSEEAGRVVLTVCTLLSHFPLETQ